MEQLDLSAFFTTKAQSSDFVSRLALVSEKLYQNEFNLETTLFDQFGMHKKEKLLALLRENNINSKSNTELKEFFDKIVEKTTSLPVLTITIAFEPKEQTLQAISQWFLINMNKQMLFDIVIDPTILGGAAFTYNGKFLDFSIKQVFDQIISDVVAHATDPKLVEKWVHLPHAPKHQELSEIHIGR